MLVYVVVGLIWLQLQMDMHRLNVNHVVGQRMF